MSELKSTLGPYHLRFVTSSDIRIVSENKDASLAGMAIWGAEYHAELLSNAHLLAASWDLYRALEKLTKAISECHACGAELLPDSGSAHCIDCPSFCECHEEPDCAQLSAIVMEAYTALAKARGEQ